MTQPIYYKQAMCTYCGTRRELDEPVCSECGKLEAITVQRQYWYKQYVHICKVCGHVTRYRERVYTIEEKNTIEKLIYCGCMDGEIYGIYG